MARLRRSHTSLTKEREFGLQRMIHHGEVARKYIGESNGQWGYLGEVCLWELISGLTVSGDKSPAPPIGIGKEHLHQGKYMPCF